jgi:heterodisulfide reductase subunit C
LLQPDLELRRFCSQADIEQLVGSPPEDVFEAVNTLLISNVQCGLCIVSCATSVPDFQFNIRNTLSMVRSRRNQASSPPR